MKTSLERKIETYCDKLELSQKATDKAKEICDKIITEGIYNEEEIKDDIVGGCIYIAAILVGERLYQVTIERELNISTHKIRKHYREIAEKINIDIVL